MHSRRALLLATSALVGIASLTAWQDRALAAGCAIDTPSAGTVTCKADTDTAAAVNTAIANEPGPNVAVIIAGTETVDVFQDNVSIPSIFGGSVSITNNGTVTPAPAQSGSAGLVINGNPANTADSGTPNNATITNTGFVNGSLRIGPNGDNGAGGTGTIVNTGTVSANVRVQSTGDATLTSNGPGSIIVHNVVVLSQAPFATVFVTGNVTTTAMTGGSATAILGDVGAMNGAAVDPVFNPDGFGVSASPITISGITSATATLSGHTGTVPLTSTSPVTIADTGIPIVDGAGNTILTTRAIVISGASVGGTSAAVVAGAQGHYRNLARAARTLKSPVSSARARPAVLLLSFRRAVSPRTKPMSRR